MSGRMFRRALQEKQPDFGSGEDCEIEADAAPQKNIFDLLGNEDEDVTGQEEDEAVKEPEQPAPTSSSSSTKPKRSKKKRGKGKKSKEEDEESIEELIKELKLSTAGPSPAEPETQEDVPVLAVNPKHLRAEEELRRIFGSKVVDDAERGLRKRRALRKMNLVTPMEGWPRWTGGMSMEVCDTRDGKTYFRYVHSHSYSLVQQQYDMVVGYHNPDMVAGLLAKHPYHVDSLLVLAELYRHVGEYQRSALLLEKCLYALESAWHPWFNPMNGSCRLEYSVPENRALFQALHRHMQDLAKRGCHRTALELCKLLLGLDPEDPCGALFYIDYYAIRAEQYEWLELFVEKYQSKLALAVLPSFSFSLPVARFYLESKGKADDKVPYSELLQQALMVHPTLLEKIVARAPIQEDEEWTKLLKHPFFSKANAGGPTLKHLIDIYIERNSLIWRVPDLQKLLKEAASAVIGAAARREAANWACARDEAFQAVHNEYQHLKVSDYSDSTPTLTPELAQFGNPPRREERRNNNASGRFRMRDENSLLAFLRTMAPWVNYDDHDPEDDNESENDSEYEFREEAEDD